MVIDRRWRWEGESVQWGESMQQQHVTGGCSGSLLASSSFLFWTGTTRDREGKIISDPKGVWDCFNWQKKERTRLDDPLLAWPENNYPSGFLTENNEEERKEKQSQNNDFMGVFLLLSQGKEVVSSLLFTENSNHLRWFHWQSMKKKREEEVVGLSFVFYSYHGEKKQQQK